MGRLNKLSALAATGLRRKIPPMGTSVLEKGRPGPRSRPTRARLEPVTAVQTESSERKSRTSPAKSDAGSCKDSGYESSSQRSSSKSPLPPITALSHELSESQVDDSICVDCQWQDCVVPPLPSLDRLLDHLLSVHVQPQTKTRGRSRALVVCKWHDCRAADRPASVEWLRFHVTRYHAKVKPFPCLIHSCRQRFSTQEAALKHAQVHCFPVSAVDGKGGSRSTSSDNNRSMRKPSPAVSRQSSSVSSSGGSAPPEFSPFLSAARKHARHDKIKKRVNSTAASSLTTNALSRRAYESSDQREQLRRCNVFKGGIEYNTLDGRAMERLRDDVFIAQLHVKRGSPLPTHLLPRVNCRRTLPDGQVELLCSFAHIDLPDEWIPLERCKVMGIKSPDFKDSL